MDATEIPIVLNITSSQFIIDIAVVLVICAIELASVSLIEKHIVHLYPPRNCSEPAIPPEYIFTSKPMRLIAVDPPIAFDVKSMPEIHTANNFLSCNIGKVNNPADDQARRDILLLRRLCTIGGNSHIERSGELALYLFSNVHVIKYKDMKVAY